VEILPSGQGPRPTPAKILPIGQLLTKTGASLPLWEKEGKTEDQKTRACLLAPVETAMGAKLPESGRESTSMCHLIFRVMLFCLNGVTHDGSRGRIGERGLPSAAWLAKRVPRFGGVSNPSIW
jgi:hypothetical protein